MSERTSPDIGSRSRAFWITLVLALVLAEGMARIAYPWTLRLGPEGYLSSAPYVRDVLSGARSSNATVVMGDSILGASALREHQVESPRQFQLSAMVKEKLASSHHPVVTVAADGMLPADMDGALSLAPLSDRSLVVVVLNVRMFSPEFQVAEREFFFPFLKRDDPHGRDGLLRMSDERLGSWMFDSVVKMSTLFRILYQARGFWFTPNPQAAFQVLIERVFGDPMDADLKDAILRSRVESFYAPRLWQETDLQVVKLRELVHQMASHGTRVLVIMAPQNIQFFSAEGQAKQLHDNVERLSSWLRGVRGVRFRSFLDAYPSEEFLDHCHLSPHGNRAFADAIAQEMEAMHES